MVKHVQTIHQQRPTICLSVLNHFVWLALKGLTKYILDFNFQSSNYLDKAMSDTQNFSAFPSFVLSPEKLLSTSFSD